MQCRPTSKGEDASKVKKDFYLKEEVLGKVTEWDLDCYAITFIKAPVPASEA